MPLNQTDLANEIDSLLDSYASELRALIGAQALPLLAQQLQDDAETAADEVERLTEVFDTLSMEIADALAQVTTFDVDKAVIAANALNDITAISGITASGVGDILTVTLAIEEEADIPSLSLDPDFGLLDGLFGFSGGLDLSVSAGINTSFTVDLDTGDVTVDTAARDDEIVLSLEGEVAVDAEGDLGFLTVEVTDNLPETEGMTPGTPEIDFDLVIDLSDDGGTPGALFTDADARVRGQALLDVGIETNPGNEALEFALPTFLADVRLGFDYSGGLSFEPVAEGELDPLLNGLTLELRDVSLKLKPLTDVLGSILNVLNDVINTFPLGEIVDLLTSRLPVIDDIAPKSGPLNFDFDDSGTITLRDVIEFASIVNPDDPVFGFIDAVVTVADILSAIEDLSEADGCFKLGTITLTGELAQRVARGDAVSLSDVISASPDVDALKDLLDAIDRLGRLLGIDEGEITGTSSATAAAEAPDAAPSDAVEAAAAFPTVDVASAADGVAVNGGLPADSDEFGLSVPLLEDPLETAGLLLLNFLGGPPVTLFELDLPPLGFREETQVDLIATPFVGYVGGGFFGEVDISVGYDTAGFSAEGFDFGEGFFVSGDLPAVETMGELRQPAAKIGLELFAGGGVDIVLARVAIEGGLLGTIDAFLGDPNLDGKSRFSELAGCFFDDILGQLTAGLRVVFSIGFGFFKIKKKITLAEITLVQFNIDPCPESEDDDPMEVAGGVLGRATSATSDATIILHVGDEAVNRDFSGFADADQLEFLDAARDEDGEVIEGGGKAKKETFVVGRPEVREGETPIPGQVAVNAFGVFELFGSQTDPVTVVQANAGTEADVLEIVEDLAVKAEFDGGSGDDLLKGGAVGDLLRGGDGEDELFGRGGDDTLEGGDGDDIFVGGAGADIIDGQGGDFDQVSYEDSPAAVSFVKTASGFLGSGGDAQGDTLISIEYISGSRFNDVLFGNPSVSSILLGNGGRDSLLGGATEDLIVGGAGADTLIGNDGSHSGDLDDRTTYAESTGAVTIDLVANIASGGDAQGDVFVSIEHFQLSTRGDVFRGDGADNIVDGFDGDDDLRGGGGEDSIDGGIGNDTVEGGLDGDRLIGGGFTNFLRGRDVLSYALASAAVEVRLLPVGGGDGDGFARFRFGGGDTDAIERARFLERREIPEGADPTPFFSEKTTTIRLSSFEDLVGSAFDDILVADDFRNRIEGGNGNDSLNGERNDDTLIGGVGSDTLRGGTGRDWADYSDSASAVYVDLEGVGVPADPSLPGDGFAGDALGDVLGGIENLLGTDFDDTLFGDSQRNFIDPGKAVEGNQSGGFDIREFVDGRDGDDTLRLDYSDGTFEGDASLFLTPEGDGSFLIQERTTSISSAFVDIDSLENIQVFTGDGDDALTSLGIGDDIGYTGRGEDNLNFGYGRDFINAGPDNDEVTRFITQNDVTEFPGLVVEDKDRDTTFVLDGGPGYDILDIDLSAEPREDYFLISTGFTGAESSQVFRTSTGGVFKNFENFRNVRTGSGDDILYDFALLDNRYETGAGADAVAPGFGVDYADGGESFTFTEEDGLVEDLDILLITFAGLTGSLNLTVPKGEPIDGRFVYSGGIDNLTSRLDFLNFEILFAAGSAGDDFIVGFDQADPTTGDFLNGDAGNDIINGGDGADTIFGSFGLDTINGGEDNDAINGNENADDVRGNGGDDSVFGGDGDDIVDGDDTIADDIGGGGNDTVLGEAGDDTLFGRTGNDSLLGGEGDDSLEAGAGDDTLNGGGGVDAMTGGTGADLFILGDSGGTLYPYDPGGSSGAIVLDFRPTEGDVIQLSGSLAEISIELVSSSVTLPNGDPGYLYALSNTVAGAPSAEIFAAVYSDIEDLTLVDPGFVFVAPLTPLSKEKSLASDTSAVGDDASPAVERGATQDADDLLTILSSPVTSSLELTGSLWQKGAIDAVTLGQSVSSGMERMLSASSPSEGANTEGVSTDTINLTDLGGVGTIDDMASTSDVAFQLNSMINRAGNDFIFDFIDISVIGQLEGNTEAVGTFSDSPDGNQTGVVLSTGRVSEIFGENTEDGRYNTGPRPGTDRPLQFENLGIIDGTTQSYLLRAELPDVAGGIQSLTIRDDNDQIGGGSGDFTAFDFEAIFISDEFVSQADISGDIVDINDVNVNLSREDVFDFTPEGTFFTAGEQRPVTDPNLIGEIYGMPDLGGAALDVAGDYNSSDLTGLISLGDGGELQFNLTAPVASTENDPKYVYIVEFGSPEDIEGAISVSNAPVEVIGDLSTDFGAPGPDGDRVFYEGFFLVDFNSLEDGQKPYDVVEFFEGLLVTEELPERAGSLTMDKVSIKINGVDAITGTRGQSIALDTLGRTPFGGFDADLTLNLAGEGPMTDSLRADAYTETFRVAGPVVEGLNTITIELADGADGLLDTAIFLKEVEQPLVVLSDDADSFTLGSDPGTEVRGQSGDDDIKGGAFDDELRGGIGLDTIEGGSGNDTVNGGDDADHLTGDAGNDIVEGGEGPDTLVGADGDDLIFGDQQSGFGGDSSGDLLQGNDGADTLDGQLGDDTLEGGRGNDSINGGPGAGDEAVYSQASLADGIVDVDTEGRLVVSGATIDGTDTLTGVERLVFRNGAQDGGDLIVPVIDGDIIPVVAQDDQATIVVTEPALPEADVIAGPLSPVDMPTNNVLLDDFHLDEAGIVPLDDPSANIKRVVAIEGEGSASPILFGKSGSAEGSFGTLEMNSDGTFDYVPDTDAFRAVPDGETVTDTFTYSVDDDTGNRDSATLTITATKADDPIPAINTLAGTAGDDLLVGSMAAPNDIRGFGGNDTIEGQGFNDMLDGGDGSDVIGGRGGNDDIFAGMGADTVFGGTGSDRIVGGDDGDLLYGDLSPGGVPSASEATVERTALFAEDESILPMLDDSAAA